MSLFLEVLHAIDNEKGNLERNPSWESNGWDSN